MAADRPSLFRHVDATLIRISAVDAPRFDVWPNLHGDAVVGEGCAWLASVWAHPEFADAVAVASPGLAAGVEAVCSGYRPGPAQVRRMVMALARYMVRVRGRSTPFGLFAGVAPVRLGSDATVTWGGVHRAKVRADMVWLAAVIAQLEADPLVRRRLRVVANNLLQVRGDRLEVMWQPPASDPSWGRIEHVSVGFSPAVQASLKLACSSVGVGALVGWLAAEHDSPQAAADGMVAELIRLGVLVSNLRPPSTCTDGLTHVLAEVDTFADVGEVAERLLAELRVIRALLGGRPRTGHVDAPARKVVASRMRALTGTAAETQPLTVNLLLDCAVTLPEQVAAEASVAAGTLARLSRHPAGHPAWRAYHMEFVNRYGVGAVVPLRQLVDPVAGIGFPAHHSGGSEERAPLSERDEQLFALAQQAALNGTIEVVLDEELIGRLSGGQLPAVVTDAEVCAEVRASSLPYLQEGTFTLAITGVGRSGTACAGRFLDLISAIERRRMAAVHRQLPVSVGGAGRAQVSCVPWHRRLENVTHTVRLAPHVIALAEHHDGNDVIGVDDLAVTVDADRFHVVHVAERRLVEPTLSNAASLKGVPPLARLLFELPRALSAEVTPFSWGAAADLPFLPRLRCGRTILAAARWQVGADALPGPKVSTMEWERAFKEVRARLRLPENVYVGERDRRLRLSLEEPMDLALLRAYIDKNPSATTVTEAPDAADHGWIGGRAHEIVIPVASARPAADPPTVLASRAPLPMIRPDDDVLPGGRVVSAKVYASPAMHDVILTKHLPGLVHLAGDLVEHWWFIRFRDPRSHLRLRLHLADPAAWGSVASLVGRWAAELRTHGLAADLVLDTYQPETARYGAEAALKAAEELFAADSAVATAQLRLLARVRTVDARALTAASMVALVTAMADSAQEGMRWLLERPHASGDALDRALLRQAVALADQDHPHRRGELADVWKRRMFSAAAYATVLDGTHLTPSEVLTPLLHLHHVRAIGLQPGSERTCRRLARAVALAHAHRKGSQG
ncbi:lantibiotic dehydratase [Rhizohabitans arisaemae]|uniref:lantibiotic dehydratase n=1 Tax=Rhizohabitans arisaemae TaxID=2720610 RepID=UPI0024B0D669|nr:lantibiotic dehydratase [Rhizohabitans arisaemae]